MPLADSLRMVLAPPHRAGYPFLAGGGAAMLLGLFLGGWLFWPGALFTAFCLYFFRDPERVPPDRRGVILAPADGRVISVAPVIPPEELGLGERPLWRVAIFLSVLDVHVNRSPAAGRVVRIVYHPGKFLAAHLDKAAEENERNGMVIETWGGRLIGCV
ncbi:MAG: phosphatidylserine decarboxylase, partial [Rhodovarius sp.]|nr:phosphatidylserine decarboxylase [Rhodovarius sp.]